MNIQFLILFFLNYFIFQLYCLDDNETNKLKPTWNEEYYENMPIDHFNKNDLRTFKLRFKFYFLIIYLIKKVFNKYKICSSKK